MIREIEIPIYSAVVHFINQPDPKEMEQWFKEMKASGLISCEDLTDMKAWLHGDENVGQVFTLEKGNYATCVRTLPGVDYDTDCHELLHTTILVLTDRGVELEGVGEAYCYLHGWLGEQYFKTGLTPKKKTK